MKSGTYFLCVSMGGYCNELYDVELAVARSHACMRQGHATVDTELLPQMSDQPSIITYYGIRQVGLQPLVQQNEYLKSYKSHTNSTTRHDQGEFGSSTTGTPPYRGLYLMSSY
jgi:hypothetical protein